MDLTENLAYAFLTGKRPADTRLLKPKTVISIWYSSISNYGISSNYLGCVPGICSFFSSSICSWLNKKSQSYSTQANEARTTGPVSLSCGSSKEYFTGYHLGIGMRSSVDKSSTSLRKMDALPIYSSSLANHPISVSKKLRMIGGASLISLNSDKNSFVSQYRGLLVCSTTAVLMFQSSGVQHSTYGSDAPVSSHGGKLSAWQIYALILKAFILFCGCLFHDYTVFGSQTPSFQVS